MGYNAAPLEKLIEEFSKFPGIGRKGATRMAYQVLSMSDKDAAALADAIRGAHTRLHGSHSGCPHQAPSLPYLPELYRSGYLPHLCQCKTRPFCDLRGGNAPRCAGV